MSVGLADQIAAAKQRAQIIKWDAQEALLAAALPIRPEAVDLSTDARTCLDAFQAWTTLKSVRKCPAKPTTVAAFCLEQATLGVDPQQIMAQLGAIEKSHDKFNLPNPVRTAVVDIVLEQIVKSEPPRSWNKDEKAEWAKLPARLRDAISRHEKDRDRELRRLQNQAAENRRHDGAAKPIKTEGTEHYGQI